MNGNTTTSTAVMTNKGITSNKKNGDWLANAKLRQLCKEEWFHILSFGLSDSVFNIISIFLTNKFFYNETHNNHLFWKMLIYIMLSPYLRTFKNKNKKSFEDKLLNVNNNLNQFNLAYIENCKVIYGSFIKSSNLQKKLRKIREEHYRINNLIKNLEIEQNNSIYFKELFLIILSNLVKLSYDSDGFLNYKNFNKYLTKINKSLEILKFGFEQEKNSFVKEGNSMNILNNLQICYTNELNNLKELYYDKYSKNKEFELLTLEEKSLKYVIEQYIFTKFSFFIKNSVMEGQFNSLLVELFNLSKKGCFNLRLEILFNLIKNKECYMPYLESSLDFYLKAVNNNKNNVLQKDLKEIIKNLISNDYFKLKDKMSNSLQKVYKDIYTNKNYENIDPFNLLIYSYNGILYHFIVNILINNFKIKNIYLNNEFNNFGFFIDEIINLLIYLIDNYDLNITIENNLNFENFISYFVKNYNLEENNLEENLLQTTNNDRFKFLNYILNEKINYKITEIEIQLLISNFYNIEIIERAILLYLKQNNLTINNNSDENLKTNVNNLNEDYKDNNQDKNLNVDNSETGTKIENHTYMENNQEDGKVKMLYLLNFMFDKELNFEKQKEYIIYFFEKYNLADAVQYCNVNLLQYFCYKTYNYFLNVKTESIDIFYNQLIELTNLLCNYINIHFNCKDISFLENIFFNRILSFLSQQETEINFLHTVVQEKLKLHPNLLNNVFDTSLFVNNQSISTLEILYYSTNIIENELIGNYWNNYFKYLYEKMKDDIANIDEKRIMDFSCYKYDFMSLFDPLDQFISLTYLQYFKIEKLMELMSIQLDN
ncbi:hypothetical protein ABK040_002329 [Willaertia magna]